MSVLWPSKYAKIRFRPGRPLSRLERGHPSPFAIPLDTDPPSALAMRPPRSPARSTPMASSQECTTLTYIASLSHCRLVVVWRCGGALVSINEVNLRRVRLVPGWVTVSRFNSRCGTFISLCNQPPMQVNSAWPSLRG